MLNVVLYTKAELTKPKLKFPVLTQLIAWLAISVNVAPSRNTTIGKWFALVFNNELV